MFGYITVNKNSLSESDLNQYKKYYCGLCHKLQQQFGYSGRMLLTYDLTFLYLLDSGLYEGHNSLFSKRCPAHPVRGREYIINDYVSYASDMSVMLVYNKLLDDIHDGEKAIAPRFLSWHLSEYYKKLSNFYSRQNFVMLESLGQLSEAEENNNYDYDTVSGIFGRMLAEIFIIKRDIWYPYLYDLGYFLGKFIYLMDAYEDLSKDITKGKYNPLSEIYKDNSFEVKIQNSLEITAAQCAQAFEHLPIVENYSILHNILYSGMWDRYNHLKKQQEGK